MMCEPITVPFIVVLIFFSTVILVLGFASLKLLSSNIIVTQESTYDKQD